MVKIRDFDFLTDFSQRVIKSIVIAHDESILNFIALLP